MIFHVPEAEGYGQDAGCSGPGAQGIPPLIGQRMGKLSLTFPDLSSYWHFSPTVEYRMGLGVGMKIPLTLEKALAGDQTAPGPASYHVELEVGIPMQRSNELAGTLTWRVISLPQSFDQRFRISDAMKN